jgi:ribosomal protein S9
MEQATKPKFDVDVQLTGNDGNAFAIMGAVSKAIKKAGATSEQVKEYMDESMSGNYDNLLRVACRWANCS